MRAEPPQPQRGRPEQQRQSAPSRPHGRRCPYLEQIIKDNAGPFGLLTRYKADCHVDHRTHTFTGRHPSPPCITQPATCRLYRDQWDAESHLIDRYRD